MRAAEFCYLCQPAVIQLLEVPIRKCTSHQASFARVAWNDRGGAASRPTHLRTLSLPFAVAGCTEAPSDIPDPGNTCAPTCGDETPVCDASGSIPVCKCRVSPDSCSEEKQCNASTGQCESAMRIECTPACGSDEACVDGECWPCEAETKEAFCA